MCFSMKITIITHGLHTYSYTWACFTCGPRTYCISTDGFHLKNVTIDGNLRTCLPLLDNLNSTPLGQLLRDKTLARLLTQKYSYCIFMLILIPLIKKNITQNILCFIQYSSEVTLHSLTFFCRVASSTR